MSAVVCGKRSSIFEESPSSPPVSKRIRCSSSSSPGRAFSPPRVAAASACWFSSSSSHLDHLVALFPDMDRKFLEKALEESGDDLDSAIKRLHELSLSAAEFVPDAAQAIDALFSAQVSWAVINMNIVAFTQHDYALFRDAGPVANNGGTAPREEPPGGTSIPPSGAEWVELLVREVFNASNIEDAKARVLQALEALDKSICANATAEAAQSFHKDNIVLKQNLEALIQENAILKRAVFIQHERQEYDEMGQEMHKLKQLVSQYQEQVRTLEVNNYALAMHLKQAQQSNSISGRFHPDVF